MRLERGPPQLLVHLLCLFSLGLFSHHRGIPLQSRENVVHAADVLAMRGGWDGGLERALLELKRGLDLQEHIGRVRLV